MDTDLLYKHNFSSNSSAELIASLWWEIKFHLPGSLYYENQQFLCHV